MKNFKTYLLVVITLIAVAFSLASCSAELVTPEPVTPDSCTIGHIEVLDTNVKFVRNPEFDLIVCHYPSEYGMLTVTWVDGQINWSCIGFTRKCEAYSITVEAGDQTCTFTIPGGIGCNL